MYCPNCRCEFEGWVRNCPDCRTTLLEVSPDIEEISSIPISYEALVELVRENGGQLSIDLSTTDVGMRRKRGFPYFGYRYSWVKRMQGAKNGIDVDLLTTDVGTEIRRRFPYLGYGYAWEKTLDGNIAGNSITLKATKVHKESKWSFPYSGFGYAWTQELSGDCGGELEATFETTDVARKRGWGFPYFGFGSAWVKKGTLTLKLME
jgi:hypothetical protein